MVQLLLKCPYTLNPKPQLVPKLNPKPLVGGKTSPRIVHTMRRDSGHAEDFSKRGPVLGF